MLAVHLGWSEKDMSPPTDAVWGWGIKTLVKDFARDVLKTATIGRTAAMVMSGSTFSDNTVLYRGTMDSPVGNSFNIRVLDKPYGLDASHFRDLASQDHPPGPQRAVDSSIGGRTAMELAELRTRIAQLEQPRQDDQGRERWNNDDAGPPQNDTALVGGTSPLDRQGVVPLQAELGVGATRALTERLPVRPSTGAWEQQPQG